MFESIHSELAHLFKYKIAADKASDNIMITDAEAKILFINEATTKNIGYTYEEVVGRKVCDLDLWGHPMGDHHCRRLWRTITEKKETFSGEVNSRRKNGAKYLADLNIFPILGEQGNVKFFVSVERDISKEHEIDQSKNDFISLASHQLRTPLTSISLAIDVILRNPDLSERQKNSLKDIHREIFEMADLIEALLDVSKIQLGTYVADPEPTYVNDIAGSTVAQFKTHLEKKHLCLKDSYDPQIPLIMSSPNVIKIVLQNLLSNAIKYTPRGGHIAVNTAMDKDKIIVSVADTGWGIPEDQQKGIFSKFFRAYNITKRDAGGSGLGLYLAKHLLSTIGGDVWFESVENEGSTFSFSIPVDENNILRDQIAN
jgi:PAS domain S-box-containing protein